MQSLIEARSDLSRILVCTPFFETLLLWLTMAAVIAMRTMFIRIGCTAVASQVIVDNQGLDTLNEILVLIDDVMESICKRIRRRDTIPATVADAPPVVNPPAGTPDNVYTENHLKLFSFYVRHQKCVSSRSPAYVNSTTLETICQLRETSRNRIHVQSSDRHPNDKRKRLA